MLDVLFSEWTMAGIGAAAVAIAWFFPQFRQAAIAVAVAAAGLLTARRIGRHEGAADKQKEWDDAILRDVQRGEAARRDAERDVDAGRVRGDQWNRDRR